MTTNDKPDPIITTMDNLRAEINDSLRREIGRITKIAKLEDALNKNTVGDWREWNEYRWLLGPDEK